MTWQECLREHIAPHFQRVALESLAAHLRSGGELLCRDRWVRSDPSGYVVESCPFCWLGWLGRAGVPEDAVHEFVDEKQRVIGHVISDFTHPWDESEFTAAELLAELESILSTEEQPCPLAMNDG